MTITVPLVQGPNAYHTNEGDTFFCRQEFDQFFENVPQRFVLEVSDRKLKNSKSVWISRPLLLYRWNVLIPGHLSNSQCFENAVDRFLDKYFPIECKGTPRQLFFRIVA